MQNSSYLGVSILSSKQGRYRVEISKVVEVKGVKYFSAQISEKVRSYWQPIVSGVGLLETEIKAYLDETVQ